MTDPAAFVAAALGSLAESRPLDEATLAEFRRTPELREQLSRVAEASRLLSEAEDYAQRAKAVLRREIAVLNHLNLREIERERGIKFDA
jgi:hypothetical protein